MTYKYFDFFCIRKIDRVVRDVGGCLVESGYVKYFNFY